MNIQQELRSLSDPKKAKDLQRFFKTGKGQYGEGDRFLGVVVPNVRKVVKRFPDMTLKEIQELLVSPYHEERLLALLLLVFRFEKGDEDTKKEIFAFYIENHTSINNWDLVDLSAPRVVGAFLYGKKETIRTGLARSKNLWERRIAIVSTLFDITKGDPEPTLRIAEILVYDKEDLIHKAVGWMLREVGKRCSQDKEEEFLKKYHTTMPRTMLRYAIERFSEEKRKRYLSKST